MDNKFYNSSFFQDVGVKSDDTTWTDFFNDKQHNLQMALTGTSDTPLSNALPQGQTFANQGSDAGVVNPLEMFARNSNQVTPTPMPVPTAMEMFDLKSVGQNQALLDANAANAGLVQSQTPVGTYDTPAGQLTTQQIKDLQTSLGVTPDGIWGANTEFAYGTSTNNPTSTSAGTDLSMFQAPTAMPVPTNQQRFDMQTMGNEPVTEDTNFFGDLYDSTLGEGGLDISGMDMYNIGSGIYGMYASNEARKDALDISRRKVGVAEGELAIAQENQADTRARRAKMAEEAK